jgi:hypothetical protein
VYVAYLSNRYAPDKGFLSDFTIRRLGHDRRSVELVGLSSHAHKFACRDEIYVALGVALEDSVASWRILPVWLNDPAPADSSQKTFPDKRRQQRRPKRKPLSADQAKKS